MMGFVIELITSFVINQFCKVLRWANYS